MWSAFLALIISLQAVHYGEATGGEQVRPASKHGFSFLPTPAYGGGAKSGAPGSRNAEEGSCPVCKTVLDGALPGFYKLAYMDDPRCADGCVYSREDNLYCFKKGGDKVEYDCPEDNNATILVRKSLAAYDHAECNDGSIATYYLEERDEPAEALMLFLPEGGACGTPEMCLQRCEMFPWLCTAETNPRLRMEGMYWSSDPVENPPFHNHQKVYVPYCSSDLYAGFAHDNVTGYVFHGHYIMEGIIADLSEEIRAAKQVVLFGHSAGGFGVTLNCDHVAENIHKDNPDVDVRCITDGSDFYPYWVKKNESCMLKDIIRESEAYWEAPQDQSCLAMHNGSDRHCLMLGDYYKYIDTPLMTINAYIDIEWAMHPCTPEYPSQPEFWPTYREEMEKLALNFTTEKPDNGIFLLHCEAHIVTHVHTYWDGVPIDVNGTGIVLKEAIYNFLNPGSGPHQVMDGPDAFHDQCRNAA